MFLCSAKKLEKQHTTGFERKNVRNNYNKSRKNDSNPLKKTEICDTVFGELLYPFVGTDSEVRYGTGQLPENKAAEII